MSCLPPQGQQPAGPHLCSVLVILHQDPEQSHAVACPHARPVSTGCAQPRPLIGCAQSRPGDSFLGMGMTIPEDATRIIKMMEAVTIEELGNDEEYADIVEDMRDESNKVQLLHCQLLQHC